MGLDWRRWRFTIGASKHHLQSRALIIISQHHVQSSPPVITSHDQDAVADPEDAALFFVPVFPVAEKGNLFHPYTFLDNIISYIRAAHPYWDRSNGTDHIFFLTGDLYIK